ncbi:hypothetical protein M2323_001436 [Rhodoblastus acidophilus]|uniref:hypothetical protein n=1 Tax=Rhodoblastus acidophilus TaxID=1074 RepID=UPI0022247F6B|nr:hypothetical protein [Rhodoblastus acidophilus]MCW2283664.1 hypothetical protein [Rhodoblastus acidophilus]MCW2332524.1 hypothetical protein [Rhodoblastus acidophilus]
MTTTLHVYDRGVIMRRAWAIARQRREEQARQAFDLDVRVIAGRIVHNKPLSAHIAAIPLDLGTTQKLAWAEVKGINCQNDANGSPHGGALIVRATVARTLAPLRRMRFARVLRLMSTVARWIGSRFILARAA